MSPTLVDAPRISNITADSEGTVHLRIEGVYGRAITVEVSEDLVNWSEAANPVLAESSVELEFPTPAGAPYGFYRTVLR